MEFAKANEPVVEFESASQRARDVNEVDRIREIIFGTQMRDYDSRFGQLEERFAAGMAALDRDAKARQGESDEAVRAGLGVVGTRLDAEGDRLSTLISGVAEELRRLAAAVQEQGAALHQRVDTVRYELQHAFGQGLSTLEQRATAQQADLKTSLTSRLDALHEAGVERQRLAAALEALAHDLRQTPAR
jgi:hypothetical protein